MYDVDQCVYGKCVLEIKMKIFVLDVDQKWIICQKVTTLFPGQKHYIMSKMATLFSVLKCGRYVKNDDDISRHTTVKTMTYHEVSIH